MLVDEDPFLREVGVNTVSSEVKSMELEDPEVSSGQEASQKDRRKLLDILSV